MQKKLLPLVCYAMAATALLSGCGNDITEISRVQRTEMNFAEEGELPGCGSSEKNLLYYYNGFQVCNGTKWVELVGADGKIGENGKNGTYCVTEAIHEGQKIICDGDSVGVLKNTIASADMDINDKTKGEKGAPGDTGKAGDNGIVLVFDATPTDGNSGNNGEDGRDGIGAIVVKNSDGTYTQIAGKDSLKIYSAICGTIAYDPAGNKFCNGVTLVDKCNNQEYNPSTQFCGSDNNVHALCNGQTYDVTKQGCANNAIYTKSTCGTTSYNTATHFCDPRDSKIYKYVKIGSQTWMAQNLNYASSNSWCYNGTASNCNTYGRLYTWSAANSNCPSGWRLPSKAEWQTLYNAIGSSANMRATSWSSGKDTKGFAARPGGMRFVDPTGFSGAGSEAVWWNTTLVKNNGTNSSYSYFYLTTSSGTFPAYGRFMSSGMSVRCIKK